MANLLRAGYKMLNKSCPVCNNPIFKGKNENIFCPICKREVIIVNDLHSMHEANNDEKKSASKFSDNNGVLISLREVIKDKIKIINDLLASENQIDIIKKYTRVLLSLLKILRYIEFISQDDKKPTL